MKHLSVVHVMSWLVVVLCAQVAAQEPRKIKTTFAESPEFIEQGDTLIETARRPHWIIFYDEAKRMTEWRLLDAERNAYERHFYTYDTHGREGEIIARDANGAQRLRIVKTYASQHPLRLIEVAHHNAQDCLVKREVYHYDENFPEKSKPSRVEAFNANGELVKRSVQTYEAVTTLYTWTHYNAEGKIIGRDSYKHHSEMSDEPRTHLDTGEPTLLVLEADKDGYTFKTFVGDVLTIKYKATNELDAEGNVIKRYDTVWNAKTGETKTTGVTCFTHTFY